VAREEGATGPTTVTGVLLLLSAPTHAPCAGVTVYCQDPEGTDVSVHVSAVTVPEHAEPMVWRAFVAVSYRLTTYPLTAEPLLKVLAAQLTVTAIELTLAVGVWPAEMDIALPYPDAFAGRDQRATAARLPTRAIADAAKQTTKPRRGFMGVSPCRRTPTGSSRPDTRRGQRPASVSAPSP
jgi:hypothetical protein